MGCPRPPGPSYRFKGLKFLNKKVDKFFFSPILLKAHSQFNKGLQPHSSNHSCFFRIYFLDNLYKTSITYREIFKKPGFHAVCYISTMPRLVQIETYFFVIIHHLPLYLPLLDVMIIKNKFSSRGFREKGTISYLSAQG